MVCFRGDLCQGPQRTNSMRQITLVVPDLRVAEQLEISPIVGFNFDSGFHKY
jgi:hypothetical protein